MARRSRRKSRKISVLVDHDDIPQQVLDYYTSHFVNLKYAVFIVNNAVPRLRTVKIEGPPDVWKYDWYDGEWRMDKAEVKKHRPRISRLMSTVDRLLFLKRYGYRYLRFEYKTLFEGKWHPFYNKVRWSIPIDIAIEDISILRDNEVFLDILKQT
jgi:hypothetical protein